MTAETSGCHSFSCHCIHARHRDYLQTNEEVEAPIAYPSPRLLSPNVQKRQPRLLLYMRTSYISSCCFRSWCQLKLFSCWGPKCPIAYFDNIVPAPCEGSRLPLPRSRFVGGEDNDLSSPHLGGGEGVSRGSSSRLLRRVRSMI